MGEGYGFIDSPDTLRGVRIRPGVKGYLVKIRPRKWRKTIWLGTYTTAQEAARAYDAGIFYTRKKIDLNFHDSATSFVEIPPVSLEEAQKSESSMELFKVFVKNQGVKAARRARNGLKVMWFKFCRIFWL
jgi:hypothetical protein